MAEDIFKYRSVTEWNGYVVEFGLPSTDGNLRLTEIVLGSDSCLEATQTAIDLSWINSEFALARTSPVLKIIRTLFGGDGDKVITFPLVVDGVYYIMGPPTEFAVEFPDEDWEVNIVHADAFDLSIDLMTRDISVEVGTDEFWQLFVGSGIFLQDITKTAIIEKHAYNPRWVPYTAATSTSPAIFTETGYDPYDEGWWDPTHWDNDGAPWVEVQWSDIMVQQECSADFGLYAMGNIGICEEQVRSGFCRQVDFQEPLVISNKHTAKCSNNDLKTKILCEEAEYTWTPIAIPYSNKEEVFPASDKAFLLQPLKEAQCTGINLDPEWGTYTVETLGHNSNSYEYEFVDLETPLGFVPGTAVITMVRFRGDFEWYKEFIDVSIGMSVSWENIGQYAESQSSGVWQDATDGVFSPFVLSGYGTQQSELGTYQGKVGFFTGIQPSEEVNNTTNYCTDLITGEPFPPGNYKNWYESYCIVDNSYGPPGFWHEDLPWWTIQFEIRAEEEVGLIDNWTNGGKCLFTSDQWLGGAGADWKQAGSFTSRTMCMETSQTMPQWDDYYLMWIEETNYWTKVYHNWIGTTGSSTYFHGAPNNSRMWFPPGGGPWTHGREPYCYPSGAGTCSNQAYNYNPNNWGGPYNETYYWRNLCLEYDYDWYDADTEGVCLALGQGVPTNEGGTWWVDYGNYWGGGHPTVWENLAAGNMAVDGSMYHHRSYNLLTSKSHRIHPKKHLDIPLEAIFPYVAGTSARMNHRDINLSWGNGAEVGRATIPTWITNSFNWPDADRIYDYCHMRGWNAAQTHYSEYGEAPQPQWSLPLYDDIALGNPYQGWGCNTSGFCVTSPVLTGQNYVQVPEFEADSNGCTGEYRCNNQDQYAIWGLTSVECTDGGYNRRDFNPTTEVFDNTYPPSPYWCWGGETAQRADGTYGTVYAYYQCRYGGRCLDSNNNLMGLDCTNGNWGNQNGYATSGWGASWSGDAWAGVKCAAGKWNNKGSCINSGTCERYWNLHCNYNNCGWRANSGTEHSGGIRHNYGSNDYDWCMELAASQTSWCNDSWWCVGEYTTWTSDNYHWEGGTTQNDFDSSLWTPTYLSNFLDEGGTNGWGRKHIFRSGDGTTDTEFYTWQKTYAKSATENPISEHISDPELQHINQMYPAHAFVEDNTTWDGTSFEGWCSSDGTTQGNVVPLENYDEFSYFSSWSGIWHHNYGCDEAGTCSDPAYGQDNGMGSANKAYIDCEADGICSDPAHNNDESDCMRAGYCMLNGVVVPWAMDEQYDCEGMGTCSDPQFSMPESHTAPYGAYPWGYYSCTGPGNIWTPTPGTFTSTNIWTSSENVWTMYDYGWIDPPPHFASEPTEEYGYHTDERPEGALIRWKAPESFIEIGQRLYTRPTHFKIYRSPWVSPEGKSFTGSDYEEQAWTYAGEVICDHDYDFQYFLDTRKDLIKAGVGPFDRVYYRITAVWKDWNWRAGYSAITFGGYGCDGNYLTMQNWDYRFYQQWSHFAPPGSEDEFGATERLDGTCSETFNDGHTYTEAGCLGSGTCTWSQFNNDEANCTGQGTCSWSELNNNESECLAHGVCSDPTFNFYIGTGGFQNFANEAACLAYSGTCTNQSIGSCSLNWHIDHAACVASGSIWTSIIYPQFDNYGECVAEINGKCSEPLFHSDEAGCLNSAGTCGGDSSFDNNPTGCAGAGECDPNYWYENDEAGCLAANGGQGGPTPNTWIPANYTFTTTGIWTFNTWTPVTNTWTPAGLTWLDAGSCSNTNYNQDAPGCLAEGTCSDWTYHNDEAACLAQGDCSDTYYANTIDCLSVPGNCIDPSGNHIRSYGGAPLTQDWICASAGTCSGVDSSGTPAGNSWWPSNCLAVGTCANITTGANVGYVDNEEACIYDVGICSDPAHNNNGWGCIGPGTCADPADGTPYPQWDNDRYACAGAFGGDFSEPFWHRSWDWWTPDNTWTPENEFTRTNTFTSRGTWTNSCSDPAFGSGNSGTIVDGDLPGCLSAGDCSDPQWDNEEVTCLANFSCSDLAYTTQSLCESAGICSDSNWTIEVDCDGAGFCTDVIFHNNEVGCLANGTCMAVSGNHPTWGSADNEAGCESQGECFPDSMNFYESSCLNEGTCDDPAFNNNRVGCLGQGICLDSNKNDDEAACMDETSGGVCSNTQYGGYDPYQYTTEATCINDGACPAETMYNSDPFGCENYSGTCFPDTMMWNEQYCLDAGTCSDPLWNNNLGLSSGFPNYGLPLSPNGCLSQGTCSDPTYDNYVENCLSHGVCSDATWNNNRNYCLGPGTCVGDSNLDDNPGPCVQDSGTCSDPAFNNSMSPYDDCVGPGICTNHMWNDDAWNCYWAGETFTHTNTWTPTYTWIPDNTWTPETWTQTGIWTFTNTWTPGVHTYNTWTPNTWTATPGTYTSVNTWDYFYWVPETWTPANNTWTPTPGTWDENTWTSASNTWDGNTWYNETWTSAGNTWNGPIWTSDNYTWSLGSWGGIPHPNYAWYGKTLFHLIEEYDPVTMINNFPNPNHMVIGRSLVNAATLWHPIAGDEWGDMDDGSNTVRYTGFFKAPMSGEYQFKVSSYDASYLWLGENGWSMNDLVAWREHDNYLAGCPGDHGLHDSGEEGWDGIGPIAAVPGYQFHIGRISLVKDEVYPLLAYFTSFSQSPCQMNPHWRPKWDIRVHYPDGDWNNGGTGEGVWGTGTFSMMPGYLSPTGSGSGFNPSHSSGNSPGPAFVQPTMNGQTVEGIHTNEGLSLLILTQEETDEYEGDIYSFYTDT